MDNSILLIGKPHSSKTVFLSQLYSRLQKKRSKLFLYKPVDDLTPISAAREALANGDEPEPTHPDKSLEFLLPIQSGDKKIDLLCPEYGGEQVSTIIDSREVNKEWSNAISRSDNWVLFVRLNSINKQADISDVTISEQHNNAGQATENPYSMSDQSSFIELLQILLFIKGHDYHIRNNKVNLTVVLTCWDELNENRLPIEILKIRLPLFSTFLLSNWTDENLTVCGLSALGFSLQDPGNKEKYLIDGPESFGYLILPDGTMSEDITQLITYAVK